MTDVDRQVMSEELKIIARDLHYRLIEDCGLTQNNVARDIIIEAIEKVRPSLPDGWVSVEEFIKTPSRYCWILYKNKIHWASYSYCGGQRVFFHDGNTTSCYMTECISAVMPINEPDSPKEQR